MQKAPLQVYTSALVFSPLKSQIREESLSHYPAWFKYGSAVEDHWGMKLQTLEHDGWVTDVRCSFDGKYVASSAGKIISLWNPTTGILQSTLEGHREGIISMVFSYSGQLASCSFDRQVLIWGPQTGIIHRKLQVPDDLWPRRWEEGGLRMALALDGTLAISESTKAVYIWESDRNTSSATIKPISGLKGMTFLSRGELALVCCPKGPSKEGEILLYDLGTKAERRISIPEFDLASFSSNDHLAITIGYNKIRIYDLTTGSHQSLRYRKEPIFSLKFSFSNKGVFIGFLDQSVYHWDLKTGSKILVGTFGDAIESMVSLPDSKLAFTGFDSNEVTIWDIASPSLVQPTIGSDLTRWTRRRDNSTSASSSWPERTIGSIVFSQDGHHFAVASAYGRITLWNAATLRESRKFPRHIGYTYPIALSFHGTYLFSSGSDYVQVWDTASRKLLQASEITSPASAAAFLPNDEVLIIGTHERIVIWNLKTWDVQHSLDVAERISWIAPSQDGRLFACLVSKTEIQEIQVWDTEQYKHLWGVQLHQSGLPKIEKIFFSADSLYITTDRGHQILLEQYTAAPSSEPNMLVQRWKVEDDWLCRDGQKALWLPLSFRPSCTALRDDLFILGHDSGKVTFFKSNTHDSAPENEVVATERRSHARIRVRDFFFRRGKGN